MNLPTILIRFTNAMRPIGLWLLLVHVSVTGAMAAETNRSFVTSIMTLTFPLTPLTPAEEAERIRESRPAEDDPEGNWGGVVEGFQLSLRLEKAMFAVGEPIMATVLFRNVSQKRLGFYSGRGGRTDSRCGNFVVIKDPKILIPRIRSDEYEFASGSAMASEMEPGTQAKDTVRLDTLYDLSAPGSYLIYVKHRVFREDGSSTADILSGNASINIVGPPKPAVQNNDALNPLPANTSLPAVNPPRVPRDSNGYPLYYTETTPPPGPFFSTYHTNKGNLKSSPDKMAKHVPAQLAQAETGGGLSSRDWVFGLLVLGVVLGLVWYLFRARSPHPKS